MQKLKLSLTNGIAKNLSTKCGNSKTTIMFGMIAAMMLAFITPAIAATHTWTGAMGDGKWSTGANWSGGAPAAGEAASVILVFPAAGSKNTSNDIVNLTIDQIQISGDNYVLGATGAGTNVTLRSQVFGQTFFITGANAMVTNFNFNISTAAMADASITVATGDTATFKSRFTGAGGLTKIANGKLIMDGTLPNTYAGVTTVQGGNLDLSHSSNAIPGDLVIGYPAISNLATVTLLFQNQVADNANILVNWNGTFSPSVFSEKISSITLSNADFVAGIGLTLGGNFTSIGTNTTTGTIRLGGTDCTFDVTGYLTMEAFVENTNGTAGPIKTGTGIMEFKLANTFNGFAIVETGTLLVNHVNALGTTNHGTIVEDGATLELVSGMSITNETLSLAGAGVSSNGVLILRNGSACNGNVQLNSYSSKALVNVPVAGDLAFINGTISGNYLEKLGPGTLRLGGSGNNFFNGVTVRRGVLQLAKPPGVDAVTYELVIGQTINTSDDATVQLLATEQISHSATLYIKPSGRLDLNGFWETIPATQLMRGRITTGAGTLKLGGDITVNPVPDLYDQYTASIVGNVTLNSAERVFNLVSAANSYTHLEIDGNITDGTMSSGLKVTGAGRLDLISGPNTYSGMTLVSSNAALTLGDGALPGNTTGGTIVENGSHITLNSTSVGMESLTLHDSETNMHPAIVFSETNSWAGPINLNGHCSIYGYDDGRLTLNGSISGTGKLIKRGGAVVQLAGSNDNTFNGGTRVDHGELELNKSGGAVAIPGDLNVGTYDNFATTVRLLSNNQIANGAVVSVLITNTLDLNGFNDTIHSLVMNGGWVLSSGGTLTLLSDIAGVRLLQPSGFINGKISLAGAVHNITVISNSSIIFNAQITDPGTAGTIKFSGAGSFFLYGSNTYSGLTIVDDVYLVMSRSNGLGSTVAGTILTNNAHLSLVTAATFMPEPLTVFHAMMSCSSTNRWTGPISVSNRLSVLTSGNSPRLYLSGPISGTGVLALLRGEVVLDGTEANTLSGDIEVHNGLLTMAKTGVNAVSGRIEIGSVYTDETNAVVRLANNNQIHDLAPVAIEKLYGSSGHGIFEVNGFSDTIGSLEGDGELRCGTGKLTVGANNQGTSFEGNITGSGLTNFVKTGTSFLILNGTNTYTGQTTVNGGQLYLNGQHTNSVIVVNNTGTLGGSGFLGDVTVNSGGCVAPGSGEGAVGHLNGRTFVFNTGSKYKVEFPPLVGTNYDRIISSGMMIINNANLEVAQTSQSAVSNQFLIIDMTSGASTFGNFGGLPSGTSFAIAPNQSFSINYASGADFKDVVLTQLTVPSPSTIGDIVKLPNGQMQITGEGTPGFIYGVEANSDLNTTNWVTLGGVLASTNGVINFTDAQATNFPIRFYRFYTP